MTLFGNLNTWVLIGLAWLGCAVVVSLLFGVMARVEDRVARWRRGR